MNLKALIHNVDFYASLVAMVWSVLAVTVLPQLESLADARVSFGFATAAMARALAEVKR